MKPIYVQFKRDITRADIFGKNLANPCFDDTVLIFRGGIGVLEHYMVHQSVVTVLPLYAPEVTFSVVVPEDCVEVLGPRPEIVKHSAEEVASW